MLSWQTRLLVMSLSGNSPKRRPNSGESREHFQRIEEEQAAKNPISSGSPLLFFLTAILIAQPFDPYLPLRFLIRSILTAGRKSYVYPRARVVHFFPGIRLKGPEKAT